SLFFLPSAGLFALGRWSVRGLRRTVDLIRPVIREMGFGPFLTVSIVLQNGLLLQSIRSISLITMFFSTGGRPICPTVADAMRWTRPFRSRREKLLRGSRRKSLAEQRVAQAGEACGGSISYAVFCLKKKKQNSNPRALAELDCCLGYRPVAVLACGQLRHTGRG